jgi:hypothetical protein
VVPAGELIPADGGADPSDAGVLDEFGNSPAIFGSTAIIGASNVYTNL